MDRHRERRGGAQHAGCWNIRHARNFLRSTSVARNDRKIRCAETGTGQRALDAPLDSVSGRVPRTFFCHPFSVIPSEAGIRGSLPGTVVRETPAFPCPHSCRIALAPGAGRRGMRTAGGTAHIAVGNAPPAMGGGKDDRQGATSSVRPAALRGMTAKGYCADTGTRQERIDRLLRITMKRSDSRIDTDYDARDEVLSTAVQGDLRDRTGSRIHVDTVGHSGQRASSPAHCGKRGHSGR